MKLNLNCPPRENATPRAPQSKRLIPSFSLQKPARQGHSAAAAVGALRIPVLIQNRAYLKALRQAELASWSSTKKQAKISARADSVKPRLPSPAGERQENWIYALLALLCMGLLAKESLTLLQAAGNWHHFLGFVRSLLS